MYPYFHMAGKHQKELKKAREELATLLRKREDIEVKIARQRRKVAAWSELCDEGEYNNDAANALAERVGLTEMGGLTEACRTAMRGSRKQWMTVAEIYTALKELGFPLDKYKAPEASITTTVNRMTGGDFAEVERSNNIGGPITYRWRGGEAALNQLNELYKLSDLAGDKDLKLK
jgi:hypothetical protein